MTILLIGESSELFLFRPLLYMLSFLALQGTIGVPQLVQLSCFTDEETGRSVSRLGKDK